jgi:hypothetical protein
MSEFSDKVWWTRKSKIKAERRLLNLDTYSQILLLWHSVFLVFYSIYTLVNPVKSSSESAIMVALSVSILILTLFINNMNYKGRAMLLKQSYEQLSLIYTKAISSHGHDLAQLDKDYQSILAASENHLELDFIKAIVDESNNSTDGSKLSKHPTCIHKLLVVFYAVRNFIYFVFIFCVPFLILYFLRMGA